MKEGYLNSAAASRYLGLEDSGLTSARKRGVLHGVKPPKGIQRGRYWFYKVKDLDAWMEQFV